MNEKLIQSLAKLAKVSNVEEFTEALKSESDTDFKLPEGLVVRTAEEEDTFKTNIFENAKKEHIKAGAEIQIKNLKKATGLDFEGKDADTFIEKYKESILAEAKIEPNQKIQELTTSISNLQTKLGEKDTEIETLKKGFDSKQLKFDVRSYFPAIPESVGLTKDEATELFLMSHSKKEDGIYRNGELLKDTLENPLSLEQAVGNFVTEKKWTADPPGGRGGGAGGGQGGSGDKLTLADYEAKIKEKGLTPGSAEANAVLREMAKENPEILN